MTDKYQTACLSCNKLIISCYISLLHKNINSIGKLNQINKHNKSSIEEKQMNVKTDNVWALGNYQSISTMLPPISAHLTRLTNIQQGESVLDVACGNGNTAITARRKGA